MLILGAFTLLFLYHKYAITPTMMYGVKKRYNMPVFRPAAKEVESPLLTLLTSVVLHIAHCAKLVMLITMKNKPVSKYFFITANLHHNERNTIDSKD